MKKLILTLAIVATTTMSQAASFKWTTGTLYAPNADGSISETLASAASGTWLATVTLYSDASCETAIVGLTGNSSSSVGAMDNSIGGTFDGATFSFDNTTLYYGVLEMSYTTSAGTQVLKTDVVSTVLKGVGNTKMSFSSAISSGKWSAVPEPTSGLLLVLGIAGLALRRKQK